MQTYKTAEIQTRKTTLVLADRTAFYNFAGVGARRFDERIVVIQSGIEGFVGHNGANTLSPL